MGDEARADESKSDTEPMLVYVGDPMCSWCWGISPGIERLLSEYSLPLEVVVGGLRPGPSAQRLDEGLKGFLRGEWSQIETVTGQPFDHGLLDWEDWLYDTEPAAIAVVTMRELATPETFPFFVRLQRAFYAENVDLTDIDSYEQLVVEFPVEPHEFQNRLRSEEARQAAWADFQLARRMGVNSFPTVLLRRGEEWDLVAYGYRSPDDLATRVEELIA